MTRGRLGSRGAPGAPDEGPDAAESTSPLPRALVVDDEPQMLDIVAFALETQGFDCLTAPDAERAWRILLAERVELVVLDVMLPGASGVELCRRLRTRFDVPVILLTARGEVAERVQGLEAGADDYVTKPFSPRELALRAQGLVRRANAGLTHSDVITNGPLRIDVASGSVTIDARRVPLPDVELRLLLAFARRPGELLGWRELLNEVWSTTAAEGGREMVKTAVYRLRRSLEDGGGGAGLITTIRGRGYAMPVLSAQPSRTP